MRLSSTVVIVKGCTLDPSTSSLVFDVAHVSRLSGPKISDLRHGSAYSSSLLVFPSSEQGANDCGF